MSAFLPFSGQRVAVVGLGRAGLPAATRLRDLGAEVAAWDDDAGRRREAERAGLAIRDHGAGPMRAADALLLSPGIPHRLPAPHPAAGRAAEAGVPVLCDVEFLWRASQAARSRARFVGITGTNGKSTTTALLAHLLRSAGRGGVAEGGNLGPAALSLPLLADGAYVLEMSSYMLERLSRARFDLAALLNLSPDHLDRHGDMAGYARAKARVFEGAGVRVLGVDDEHGRATLADGMVPVSGEGPAPGGVWAEGGATLRDDDGPIADLRGAPALPGAHNAQNAAAAAALGLSLGLSREEVARGLAAFPGLPHRQERVATDADGVAWVNDSKATNADSAARALATYDRVVWIAGGVPKAGGIAPLAPLFGRVARAVLIGQSAADFAVTLRAAGVPHAVAGTLEAAVPMAREAARETGAGVVLLSPAAASFDQFTGFEARGDAFRALVRSLPSPASDPSRAAAA